LEIETLTYAWVTPCKSGEIQKDVGDNEKVALESLISKLSRFGYLKKVGSLQHTVADVGLTCSSKIP